MRTRGSGRHLTGKQDDARPRKEGSGNELPAMSRPPLDELGPDHGADHVANIENASKPAIICSFKVQRLLQAKDRAVVEEGLIKELRYQRWGLG
jgi:hypothetical protein